MNEEKNEDIETSENNEELESNEELEENEEELEETEDESQEEETDEEELSQEEYDKLKEKNKQLYARLKKLETKKVSKKEQPNKSNKQNTDLEEAMDVRFLKRDGFTDEDIDKLRVIRDGYKSLGKEITLVDATNDDLFKGIVERKKQEEKRSKAQLGASSKNFMSKKSKMSDEEFEKYRQDKSKEFLKSMGFGG